MGGGMVMLLCVEDILMLGFWLGEQLCVGDVVVFFGLFGVGKMVLVKGIVMVMDVEGLIILLMFVLV